MGPKSWKLTRGAKRMKMSRNPYRRRRRSTKIGRTVRNRTSVTNGLGFPKRQVMTHKWTTVTQPTAVVNSLGYIRIQANDVYKPDYNMPGSVHSAYYFNQMNALYDHHTVIGSRIRVEVSDIEGEVQGSPFIVGIFLDDDLSFGFTDVRTAGEQSNGYIKMVPGGNAITTKLNMKWSAKKTFGGSVLAQEKLTGNGFAGPQEQQFYTICWQNPFGGSPTVCLKIVVEYICVWSELKDIAASTSSPS